MLQTLQSWITGILAQVLQSFVQALVADPLQLALNWYTGAGSLRDFYSQPWAQYLVTYATALGGVLLALRVAWEAWQAYLVRASGGGGDPAGLLIRTVEAAAMVAGGPWLATRLLEFGNTLAADVARAPFGFNLAGAHLNIANAAAAALATVASPGLLIFSAFLWIGVLVLILLVFLQALIRSVEMLLIGILAPVMAVGQLSPDGGTASTWFREAILVVTAQAVQGLLLYLVAWFLISPFFGKGDLAGPFFALAAAWVAFKTPTILRQFTYHTGVGGGTVSAMQTATRAVLSRLPA